MLGASIIRLLVLAIAPLLGYVAYRRNPRSATHILLALLTAAIFVWGASNEISILASTVPSTLFWIRFNMAASIVMAILFMVFMHVFPKSSLSISKRPLIFLVAVTLISIGIAFSPWMFTHIEEGVGATAKPVPGPGIIAFMATAVASNIVAAIILLKKNWQLQGLAKIQARYLLLGTALMFGMLIGLILLPVIIANNTYFVPFQSTFMLPFVALTTYAVARYRLMDIRLAIARSLSFSILVGAVLLIYGVFLIFAVPYVSQRVAFNADVMAAGAALLSIPLARYVQQVLTRMTDRFLFQQRTDLRAALVKVGHRLSRTIEINTVANIILESLVENLRASKVTIYLKESESQEYLARASTNKDFSNHVVVAPDHILVRHLSHSNSIINRDEVMTLIEREQRPAHRQELAEMGSILEWVDAAVVIPLYLEQGLSGFVVVGPKKSGQPFLHDDLEFLEALAPQAAIALENARLYQESLEFGERLKVEVQRATAELEQANEQLTELDQAKSEFLSVASHQLYTPLTAIRGYLSMLTEGDFGALDTKQQPIIDIINKSAERLIDLIKNLLDISRIESGRFELNLEVVDLARMAKEIVQDLMPNAMSKDLKLLFHKPEQPIAPIIADRQRLRQVILNYVDNAIKYTEKGHIDVRVIQRGKEVEFHVSDTGKGIDPKEISELFTKFTRTKEARKSRTQGSGLGLYVARQIIKEHHGEVLVTSPGLGKGSTFMVRLPIADSARSLKVSDKATVVIKAAKAGSN